MHEVILQHHRLRLPRYQGVPSYLQAERGAVTGELLHQAADPQRWMSTYGTPLAAPRLQSVPTWQASMVQAPTPPGLSSQPQLVPSQQQHQQQQQQLLSPVGGAASSANQQWSTSSDPFAAFESPSLLQASSLQGSTQPPPTQPLPLHQQLQQMNPFDESSQPFMPRQAAMQQAGSSLNGDHQQPDLGVDLFSQPPLGQVSSQTQASQQSPLDDILQPQISSQKPQRGLQHTHSVQSMPKPLPRPKSSSQRYTEPAPYSPTYASSSHSYQPSHAGSGSTFDSFTTTGSAPSILPVLANPFAQSGFGDMSLARPSAPVLRVRKADMSPSGSPSGSPMKRESRGQAEAPLAFDARLPPLHPKLSARLTLLAAAHGSLFAGPSIRGGLLQWARPEGNMRQPKGTSAPAE